MRIRKFKKSDAKGVSNVICSAQRKNLSKHYSKKVIEKFCEWSSPSGVLKKSEKRDCWVVIESEKIIGICGIEKNIIKTMFVHPKYLKKGIGRKLVDRIESVAKRRKISIMKVDSTTYAVPFYKKCGYKKIKQNNVKYKGIRFDIVMMKKKL